MEGRRWRRVRKMYTPLPLQRARQHLSHTVSCWYCDFKITRFNDTIFALGRRYSSFFQIWFAVGVGFGVLSLIGATLVLLWDIACTYYSRSNAMLGPPLMNWLFGLDLYSGLTLSLLDVGVMIFSALEAVFVHEFGHAFAAASQGIQVEYVALFLAILFPGAFIAINCDLLQSSSSLTAFRVYCAGVWHNAVFCTVCLLAMLLLPSFLHPVYEQVEGLVDESCLTPVQTPVTAWVEIYFRRQHSSGCLYSQSDLLLAGVNGSNSIAGDCGGTFVFIGEPLSLVGSLTLSPYMPRFKSGTLALYFPYFLEKLLSCTFRFSLSLAVFNSLPVFFLDGESILEMCLMSISWFRPRTRRRVLKLSCYVGSLLLLHALSRFAVSVFLKPGWRND